MHQLVCRNVKFKKRIRPLVPGLRKCPQKRGVVQKVFIQTPKKPNSAKRKVAKVKLSTGRVISCYIPGIGHSLTKHSVVLVRGGRAQDLIGVRYKPIFGKFDFSSPEDRVSRPSKYGLDRLPIKKPDLFDGLKVRLPKHKSKSSDMHKDNASASLRVIDKVTIHSNISAYFKDRKRV